MPIRPLILGQEPQSARAVLMVRPASFGFNPQTAPSNAFQQAPDSARGVRAAGSRWPNSTPWRRRCERRGRGSAGRRRHATPPKPDAIFPNNWVSFHYDGTVALYPMLAPNRRLERREDISSRWCARGGSTFRAPSI